MKVTASVSNKREVGVREGVKEDNVICTLTLYNDERGQPTDGAALSL